MNADETEKAPNSGAFRPINPATQPPAAQTGYQPNFQPSQPSQPTTGAAPVRREGVLPQASGQPTASGTGAPPTNANPTGVSQSGSAQSRVTPPSVAPATGAQSAARPAGSSFPQAGAVPPVTAPRPSSAVPQSGTVPQRSAFRPIADPAVAAGAAAGAATASVTATTPAVTSAPPASAPNTVQAGALSLTDRMKGLTTRATNGTRDQLEKADREQAAQSSTGPRKARVLVSRIDPWSVLKIAFLLSIAAGIMMVVAVHVLWNVLAEMGVFIMINDWVLKLFTADQELNILQFVAYPKIMSAALLIAVVDVVLLTGLATIAAFLYNTIARVVGGIYLTLTDD